MKKMDRMNSYREADPREPLGPDDWDPFADPEPQASTAPRHTRRDNPPTASDPTRMIINAIEEHHRAVGAYLKTVEAHITHLQCTTYLNDPEANKALDGISKAIGKARPVLDRRRSGPTGVSSGCRPGGDAYYGPELDALHKLAYVIDTNRQNHQEYIQAQRKLDRVIPLEDPLERKWRRRELDAAERFILPDEAIQELDDTVGAVIAAARRQPQWTPGNQPLALDAPAETPMPDRHTDLRAALIENPDQPQAAFVKWFRVHPITVRRCRRELEEAGAIPILPHRHGPAQASRRRAQLAEAAD
jgi:hypothetical protein